MNFKKLITLSMCLLFCLSLIACKKNNNGDDKPDDKTCTSHVDANNDGKCDNCQADYHPSHVDGNGDGKCDVCGTTMSSGKVYAPKWDLNEIGFDGNGMTIKIKVNPVSEFDPFDANYSGDSQEIKQEHQRQVEAKYRVKIEYSVWDESAPWGPERARFVSDSFADGSFQENDVYVVNITASWIPTIVKSGALASLGTLRNGTVTSGILADFNADGEKYVQNATLNEVCSASSKVYGIAVGAPHPEEFMYYNVDLAAKTGLEDPAELWMKGEWTLSKFKEWVRAAQTNLEDGKKVLDMGFAESSLGLVASTGNQFVTIRPARICMLDDGVVEAIETIQSLYTGGYYNARGTQDVTDQFIGGETIFHHGEFWFINSSNRFDPSRMDFTLGVVPYPTADNDIIEPVLEPTSENGILLSSGDYLMKDGQYIVGLDLSNAKFRVPVTDTTCYGILNFQNGKNNINAEIVSNIMIDLTAGLGEDPNLTTQLTDEQAYRLYLEGLFDREIDIEVVMSCQDYTYFELFSAVSMTVGGGSHFGPDAFWPLCANLCKSSTDDVWTKLNEVYDKYKQAMIDMGYNPS